MVSSGSGQGPVAVFFALEIEPSRKEVKQSRNRPGVPQRIPGGLGSQIPMTFGTLRW